MDKDTASRVNVISAKLLAVAELIKAQDDESALGGQKASFGLGEILTDLSQELDEIEGALTVGPGSVPR